jgi:LacI family transcriptional regulator
MTTIRDVAKQARVSVGTVSNVLNDSPGVRDETRQRVLSAIENLNYYPVAAARSLSTQRNNTIGLIRTELRPITSQIASDPFVLDLIEGITSAAIENSTGLTFWTTAVGPEEVTLYERLVMGRQVDGFILFAVRKNDPRIAYLKQMNFPFAVFGHDGTEDETNWIDVDGAVGIELAVEHLVELGHKRIGYISPPTEQYLTHHRWSGFEAGMKKHRLAIDPSLIFEGDFSEHSGQLGAHYLLDQNDPPTAIICNNDRMAFGAMRAVQARNLIVGKDVSLVGFDDLTQARYTHPPLTTIRQPVHEIGRMLFDLLQNVINQEATEHLSRKLIIPELQVRQSTGPVA